MEEDIKKINKNNYESFINKYGTIKDEETAILMLDITSNAWLVIDESLKMNSNIIMHYQPIGLRFNKITDKDNNYYTCYYEYESGFTTPEKYFNGKMPNEVLEYYRFAIPNIEYPDGFDLEMYCIIEEELSYEREYYDEKDTNEELNNYDFCVKSNNPIISSSDKVESFYIMYDRSRLNELIDYFNKVLKRKK